MLVKKGMTGGNSRKVLAGMPKLIAIAFHPDHDETSSDPTSPTTRMDNLVKEQEWLAVAACSSRIERTGQDR